MGKVRRESEGIQGSNPCFEGEDPQMEKRQFHFRRVVKLSVSSVVGRKEEGTATETRRWTRCLGEKKSKRVDTLGMEVGWGGSRAQICAGGSDRRGPLPLSVPKRTQRRVRTPE